jgi:hypothetical protein
VDKNKDEKMKGINKQKAKQYTQNIEVMTVILVSFLLFRKANIIAKAHFEGLKIKNLTLVATSLSI